MEVMKLEILTCLCIDLVGFEKVYGITEDAKIINLRTNTEVSQWVDTYGYPHVTLSLDGKRCNKKVHRLFAEAFIPNPEEHPLVLHKGQGKDVITVDNLYWGTYSDNRVDAEKYQERPKEFVKGSGHGNSKLSDENVCEIYLLSHDKDCRLTQKEIGEMFGVSYACVSNIKRQVQWKHLTDKLK